METTCSACGAVFSSRETCRQRFDLTQGLEFSNPGYFRVHNMSVLSYMLQHNEYSREGWIAALSLLKRFLNEGVDAATARRHISDRHSGREGSWTRGPRLPGVEDIEWTRTVADVRIDTAEHYRADVREWAATVLGDSMVHFELQIE